MDEFATVKCDCTRYCGPEGKLVPPSTYHAHTRTQLLEKILMSEYGGGLGQPDSSPASEPTPPEESYRHMIKAGRELALETMTVMDEVDELRRILQQTASRKFKPASLVFVTDPSGQLSLNDPLELDSDDHNNQGFLKHREALQELDVAVDQLKTKNGSLEKLVHRLKQEIREAILSHESVLKAAEALVLKKRHIYQMEGNSAEVVVQEPNSFKRIHPLHICFMLLSTLLHSMLGLAAGPTKLVGKCVRFLVMIGIRIATRSPLEKDMERLLNQAPIDPRTAAAKLQLAPNIVVYAICPSCSARYPPLDPTISPKGYQDICTWKDLEGRLCGEKLLRSQKAGKETFWRPIRRYPYYDPRFFIAKLLSRPGIEDYMDSAPGDVEEIWSDIWNAEFLPNFTGPDRLPFFNGFGRLAFALAIDWFNPFRNMEAKKKWSIGAIYLVCLNLPLSLRFRLENVCLVGIIPGPHEPSLDQVNHFLEPLVESFKVMWSPGIWISSTHCYPEGRLIQAVIAILVADLLGARQVAGFVYHGHNYFCSYCMLPKGWMHIFDTRVWTPRNLLEHQKWSTAWKDATTYEERERIAKQHGVRWTILSELAYWNPFYQVIIDLLHLWMAICAKHARGAWHINIHLEAGDGSYDPFYVPPDIMDMATGEHAVQAKPKSALQKLKKSVLVELCLRRGMHVGGKTKKVLNIQLHEWRIEQGILTRSGNLVEGRDQIAFVMPSIDELEKSSYLETDEAKIGAATRRIYTGTGSGTSRLSKINLPVLRTLCHRMGESIVGRKKDLYERLIAHPPDLAIPKLKSRSAAPSGTLPEGPGSRFIPVMGRALLSEVREDMGHTLLPEWVKIPPKNLGDVKQGKLSSKEWRSVFTISFPITLVRLWGVGYRNKAENGQQKVLDNLLHLSLAIILSTQASLTEDVIALYELHMQQYLEGYRRLYPTHSFLPYHHIALHAPEIMRSFGPWDSDNSGPYESFNEMAQSVHTNSKFGDLELTIMDQFSVNSNFRGLLESGQLEDEAAEFGDFMLQALKSSKLGRFGRDLSPSLYGELWVPELPVGKEPPPPPISLVNGLRASHPTISPSNHKAACQKVSRGNVEFSVGSVSHRDSQIAYREREGSNIVAGRIYFMMVELDDISGGSVPPTSIFLLVERYNQLSPQDRKTDPYRTHPLIGDRGYSLAWLVYDSFIHKMDVISAKDIIGHVAICPFTPGEGGVVAFAEPTLVVMQLDRGYLTPIIDADKVRSIRSWEGLLLAPTPAPAELREAVALPPAQDPKRRNEEEPVQELAYAQKRKRAKR